MEFPDRVHVYKCDRCGETRFVGFWGHRERGVLGGKKCIGNIYRQAYMIKDESPVKGLG